MLVDTHAHIHFKDYLRHVRSGINQERLGEEFSVSAMLERASAAGIEKIICVGTSYEDSRLAVDFVPGHDNCVATVGLHPHDAKQGRLALDRLAKLINSPKVVAVGECGLDYYYSHSPKADQQAALRFQIELALAHNKPLIFHVRDAPNHPSGGGATGQAFDDFFRIIDEYQEVRGVVHSFSSTIDNLEPVLKRGFYIGLNGIMTFTQAGGQLAAAKQVPLDKLVLETDCPFLTPAPKRGTINEPANVKIIAQFLANLRGEAFETLAKATTKNAKELFKL